MVSSRPIKLWYPLVLLLTCSKAQETVTSYVSSESATATVAQGNTFTVAVGRGGHTFSPDVVQANVGDTVEWQFYPTNHSVVRAEYLLPCIPYEMTGPKVGFFSGFHVVDAILEDPPKFTVLINDTDPIFYYCSAPGSCIDWGMVGVINPNATTSLAVQKQLALNSSFQLTPGEAWPNEASSSAPAGYTAYQTSTIPPVSTATSAPAETTSAASSHSSHSTLSSGAIAGIAIGGAVVLLTAGFLIWYCGRQSRQNNNPPTSEAPPNYVPPTYGNYTQHPMSPSAKHMSGITVSTGQPSPGFPGYNYSDPQAGGHMAPFGAAQATSPHFGPHQQYYNPQQQHPMYPQMSPAFGTLQAVPVEADSERGNSPSPPPHGVHASGIEAFLARQNNMNSSAGGTSDSGGTGNDVAAPATRGHGGPGPYEMSAGGSTMENRGR